MKRISIMMLAGLLLILACRKNSNDLRDSFTNNIKQDLRAQMAAADFGTVDFSTLVKGTASPGGDVVVRIGFTGKDIFHDCIVLQTDANEKIKSGHILHVEGKISGGAKPSFNGLIETSTLSRRDKTSSTIVNGFIMSLHEAKVSVNSVRVNYECADCTLPEVIVSTSYGNGYDWTTAWLSLLSMFSDWPPNEYIPIDYSGGGGGGGGSAPSPTPVTIDRELPENKTAIETKKYTDCFGQVSGNLATYSITIAADLPVDGHPETFYNWTDGTPGHAFIQLSKSNPYETITQNLGFYPASSWTVATGHDINSKMVDDGGHEYNAKYTITVTAAQFQSALGVVASNGALSYNVSYNNCADFALAVFGAAGGSVPMYRHAIPGFGVPGGSNTPQGLYEAIRDLNNNGTAGASLGNKEYVNSSHGPCN